MTTLRSFLTDHYLLEREVSASAADNLRRAARQFGEFLDSDPTLSDLTDPNINRWILWMAETRGYSPSTIKTKRGDLLSIWDYAAECGQVAHRGKIRPVKVPELSPTSLRLSQLAAMLVAARALNGTAPRGLSLRLYFAALIGVAYDTGLRRSDLLCFDSRLLDQSGQAVVRQHKTGHSHLVQLSEQTRADIAALIAARVKMSDPDWWQPLSLPFSVGMLYYYFRKICETAGIKDAAALQALRRTGATFCERENPGSATAFLGHRSPGVAWKHYIDRRYATRPIMPPRAG